MQQPYLWRIHWGNNKDTKETHDLENRVSIYKIEETVDQLVAVDSGMEAPRWKRLHSSHPIPILGYLSNWVHRSGRWITILRRLFTFRSEDFLSHLERRDGWNKDFLMNNSHNVLHCSSRYSWPEVIPDILFLQAETCSLRLKSSHVVPYCRSIYPEV